MKASKDYWRISPRAKKWNSAEYRGLNDRLRRSLKRRNGGYYRNKFRSKEHAEYWIAKHLNGDSRFVVTEGFDLYF